MKFVDTCAKNRNTCCKAFDEYSAQVACHRQVQGAQWQLEGTYDYTVQLMINDDGLLPV